MCLYPALIKNRKYVKNLKNGGQIPPLPDQRVAYVPIGCQKCIECRKQRARGWQTRLLEEIKTARHGKFITLTFSNQSIAKLKRKIHPTLKGYDIDNAIATKATRLFLERWRAKHKEPLRHWLVTELGHGQTEHLHIHGIIWTKQPIEEIEHTWKYGWIWRGKVERRTNDKGQNITKVTNYVNERTVNYIIKYVNKTDEQHPEYKSIILTSKGIGKNYTTRPDSKSNKYNGIKTIETYRTTTGHKIAMPSYWRNKIYTDQQREKLWLHRLDKKERWICGEKVSIKHNEKNYYRLLHWHRKRNKELGYGDDSKTWEQKTYENDCRTIKVMERIQAAKQQNKRLRREV